MNNGENVEKLEHLYNINRVYINLTILEQYLAVSPNAAYSHTL